MSEFSDLVWNDRKLRFRTGVGITSGRVLSFFSKEPKTLEWIAGFGADDIFFDVGANVGMYSIAAGSMAVTTIAFEPESQNFAILNENIHVNRLNDRVTAFPIALTETTGIRHLEVSVFEPGCALHSADPEIGYRGKKPEPVYRQGVVCFSLDDFCDQLGIWPTKLKIDVDGLEPEIIRGGSRCLGWVTSLIVETDRNSNRHQIMSTVLRSHGFVGEEHFMRTDALNEGVGNWIFSRTP